MTKQTSNTFNICIPNRATRRTFLKTVYVQPGDIHVKVSFETSDFLTQFLQQQCKKGTMDQKKLSGGQATSHGLFQWGRCKWRKHGINKVRAENQMGTPTSLEPRLQSGQKRNVSGREQQCEDAKQQSWMWTMGTHICQETAMPSWPLPLVRYTWRIKEYRQDVYIK